MSSTPPCKISIVFYASAIATGLPPKVEACAPTCQEDALAGAKTKALVGDVLLGSGLALAAAGSLAVLWPRSQASGQAKQAKAAPYVVLNGKGAALGVVVKAF